MFSKKCCDTSLVMFRALNCRPRYNEGTDGLHFSKNNTTSYALRVIYIQEEKLTDWTTMMDQPRRKGPGYSHVKGAVNVELK